MSSQGLVSKWATDDSLVKKAVEQDTHKVDIVQSKYKPAERPHNKEQKPETKKPLESKWAAPLESKWATDTMEKNRILKDDSVPSRRNHRHDERHEKDKNRHDERHEKDKNRHDERHEKEKNSRNEQDKSSRRNNRRRRSSHREEAPQKVEEDMVKGDEPSEMTAGARDFASRLGLGGSSKQPSKTPTDEWEDDELEDEEVSSVKNSESRRQKDHRDDHNDKLESPTKEMTPAALTLAQRLGMVVENSQKPNKKVSSNDRASEREKFRQDRIKDKGNRDWDRNNGHGRINVKVHEKPMIKHERKGKPQTRHSEKTEAPIDKEKEIQYQQEIDKIINDFNNSDLNWADLVDDFE